MAKKFTLEPGVYRNAEGRTFRFICFALYPYQNEDLAIVETEYGTSKSRILAQNLKIFASSFKRGGYQLVPEDKSLASGFAKGRHIDKKV